MSSELAPFVAAVLRDQVVENLMKEVKTFKDLLFKIEITGRNGTPIYASGHFDEGCYQMDIAMLKTGWLCHLETHLKCPLMDLRNVEIRLGGEVQLTLYPYNDDEDDDADDDEDDHVDADDDEDDDDDRDMDYHVYYDYQVYYSTGSYNAAKSPGAKDLSLRAEANHRGDRSHGSRGSLLSTLSVDVHNWQEADWKSHSSNRSWDLRYLEQMQNASECEVEMVSLLFDVENYHVPIKKVLALHPQKSREEEQVIQEARAVSSRIHVMGMRNLRRITVFYIHQHLLVNGLNIKQTGRELEQVLPALVQSFSRVLDGGKEMEGFISEMNTDILPLSPDDPNRSTKLDRFVARILEMNQRRQARAQSLTALLPGPVR